MKSTHTVRRPAAWFLLTVVSAAAFSACGTNPDIDGSGEDSSSGGFGGKTVDSVAALVPEEFKKDGITNAIYNDYPPQEFMEGGKLVGIQPDIAQALSEVMGVEIKNVPVGSFDSLIPGTKSGRYDMSSADFGVTTDRLKEVDFVTEFQIGTGFATKEGSGITISEPTDLCGHSVGVQAGSYFIDQIKGADAECKKAGLDPIDLKTYPNDGARTLAVKNGRIEVTATNQDALGYAVDSQKLPLEIQPLVYEPVEQAIVIPDGSGLGPALQAAMKEIVSNGTYVEILEKWGVDSLAYDSPDDVLHMTDPSQLS